MNVKLHTATIFVVVDFQMMLYTQRLGMFGPSQPLHHSSGPLICYHQTVSQKKIRFACTLYYYFTLFKKSPKNKLNMFPRSVTTQREISQLQWL